MYQKAVALWHGLSSAEKAEWESLARSRHMTGFAWFMSQALKPNPGLYLPLQGGTMQGDIDMNGHKIEDLPDPLAAQEPVTRQFFEDNLPVGAYTEGARVYHSAVQTIPNVTFTFLAFNSERWDTDNIHNPAANNSRLTCRTAGKYIIIGQVYFAANANGLRQAQIFLNGATVLATVRDDPDSGLMWQRGVSTIYNLGVGDFVELNVYQNSGGNLNVTFYAQFSPEFMMQRIGA